MNPFLLPLRQKTTVEVEYIVFAGGLLKLNFAAIINACGPFFFQNLSIAAENKRCDSGHASLRNLLKFGRLSITICEATAIFLILSSPTQTARTPPVIPHARWTHFPPHSIR